MKDKGTKQKKPPQRNKNKGKHHEWTLTTNKAEVSPDMSASEGLATSESASKPLHSESARFLALETPASYFAIT